MSKKSDVRADAVGTGSAWRDFQIMTDDHQRKISEANKRYWARVQGRRADLTEEEIALLRKGGKK